MDKALQITMLGSFTITGNGKAVDDSSNRMRKVWLLLAYLIWSRNSPVTQDSYLSLLQGSGTSESEDPASRMKALFYRARAMLNDLWPNAGHELILHRNRTYSWNTQIPLTLDVEEFDRLCAEASKCDAREDALSLYLQALELYRGDFLPRLSMELWVMPIAAYYHNLYLKAVEQAVSFLEEKQDWSAIARITKRALKIEPYSEQLYQHLMRSMLALGDRTGVQTVYEEMSELLFENFGVMPSDESRRLYRKAGMQTNDQTVPIGILRDQLKEPDAAKGAVFCEYDFFRLLYQVQARALLRSGDVVHIALLSLHGQNREELSRRSLDRAMDNLKSVTVGNLRQGDVVSRCSVSQLIAMLPQANYENSCAVCQRIVKAFFRQFPHAPVDIRFSVQPLEPMMPDPSPKDLQ